MRSQARRLHAANQRTPRLYDTITFARIGRARDFLGAYYTQPVTLDHAARQACLSPFHFCRLFAEAFGETPHKFLTRLRIDHAKRLLLADNDSVTDICFQVGYSSLGSFSERFRSLTGLPPASFRREARTCFSGFAAHWSMFYIPACYQRSFLQVL